MCKGNFQEGIDKDYANPHPYILRWKEISTYANYLVWRNLYDNYELFWSTFQLKTIRCMCATVHDRSIVCAALVKFTTANLIISKHSEGISYIGLLTKQKTCWWDGGGDVTHLSGGQAGRLHKVSVRFTAATTRVFCLSAAPVPWFTLF